MTFHTKPAQFIKHMTLHVTDLEAMTNFYTNVLGMQATITADEVHLSADGTQTLLTLVPLPSPEAHHSRTTGLYHIAFLLPTRADLAHIFVHFEKLSIRLGASDHDVSEALYLHDIEGNGIEIYVDRDAQTWEWTDQHTVKMGTTYLQVQDLLQQVNGEWNGMPTNTVIGHIHLSVANLQAMHDFYTKGLGYEVVTRYGNQALFLSTNNYHHHIGMNTWESLNAPPKKPNQTGMASYTIDTANEQTAHELKERLLALGATIQPLQFGFSTVDPSGNTIHITFS